MLCFFLCRKKNNILIIIFFSLLFSINSDNCKDVNCVNCSADGSFCYVCKKGLINFHYQCVKKCKKLKSCILSNLKESICLKCNYGCKPVNGICSCTLKYILYVVYFFIIVITVGIFLYCLTHNTLARFLNQNSSIRFRPFNNIEINNSMRQFNLNPIEVKKTEEELLKDFYKNKVNINDNIDIEKKVCDCSKNMICNLLLDCGY